MFPTKRLLAITSHPLGLITTPPTSWLRLGARVMSGSAGQIPDYRGVKIIAGAIENHGPVVSGETVGNLKFGFLKIGQHFEILGRGAFCAMLASYASQRRASCLRHDHAVVVAGDHLPSDSPVACLGSLTGIFSRNAGPRRQNREAVKEN